MNQNQAQKKRKTAELKKQNEQMKTVVVVEICCLLQLFMILAILLPVCCLSVDTNVFILIERERCLHDDLSCGPTVRQWRIKCVHV